MAPLKKAVKARHAMKTASSKLKKSVMVKDIAAKHGLKAKEVNQVLDSLAAIALKKVKKSGVCTIPGLCRIKTKRNPDTRSASITESDILAAQKMWGDGLVEIGATKTNGGDYAKVARRNVGRLYAYDYSKVLFKPTLAQAPQNFRPTLDSAVSYMVGGNEEFPTDHGFALKPWVSHRFANHDIIIKEKSAQAMGSLFLTDATGVETRVEYSFGYVRDQNMPHLRIDLHHSSLPFTPSAY